MSEIVTVAANASKVKMILIFVGLTLVTGGIFAVIYWVKNNLNPEKVTKGLTDIGTNLGLGVVAGGEKVGTQLFKSGEVVAKQGIDSTVNITDNAAKELPKAGTNVGYTITKTGANIFTGAIKGIDEGLGISKGLNEVGKFFAPKPRNRKRRRKRKRKLRKNLLKSQAMFSNKLSSKYNPQLGLIGSPMKLKKGSNVITFKRNR